MKENVKSDLEGMASDEAADRGALKSRTFLKGDCPDPRCPRLEAGTCPRCKLRMGPHTETIRMLELQAELKAGVPLERDQLGIYELEVLAMLNDRDRARLAMMASAGEALRG